MVEFSYIGVLTVILPNQYQTVLEEKTKPRKSPNYMRLKEIYGEYSK